MKFPTNSEDDAKDVGSIEWRTVTCVKGDANRNKDIFSTTLFDRNGDALI